jgi:glutathione S-transferase
MLESIAAEGKWLNNGQLNLADIATGCMIGYLNFRDELSSLFLWPWRRTAPACHAAGGVVRAKLSR